jgi:serine acetyltransferase/GT2 family glycosyltransferase
MDGRSQPMPEPRISVVLATYNRLAPLRVTLEALRVQTLPPEAYEVIIVDDGSREPVAPHLEGVSFPFSLRTLRQDNAGQAAARQLGVEMARGEIVITLDDDMRLEPDFLAAHQAVHDAGARIGLGHIAAPEDETRLKIFERFHIRQLERFVSAMREGGTPRGVHVCTGNLSFRREDFHAVGGFDVSLQRSEDRELGIRLEKNGGPMVFVDDAKTRHHTDHEHAGPWLRRAYLYGVYDRRIARKHEDVESADPWRFFFLVSPLSRPLLISVILAPSIGEQAARLGLKVASWLDDMGKERAAIAGTTLVYGLQYFRGMREDAASIRVTLRDLVRYLKKRAAAGEAGPLLNFVHAVRRDYASVQRYRDKYHEEPVPLSRLPTDAVRKVGFQMLCAARAMQLAKDSRVPLLAQVTSRLIRHIYAAEIHWDARVAPGVSIVHGNGVVLSHAARVDEGCILFQNVTLGEGIDPHTREVGAPHLEADVHVGPGATLLGPITIGRGTKIMAGVTVTSSVPPGSVVRAPEPLVEQRLTVKPRPVRVVPDDNAGRAS